MQNYRRQPASSTPARASRGDATAQLKLAFRHETGSGVPQDYAVARFYYQNAIARGSAEARLRLALCHLEGWAGPVDRPAFVREVQMAAESGLIAAQRILGQLYFVGFAVPRDLAEGVKWLERAAAQDDAAAQHQLGSRAERLVATASLDISIARTWYGLSAEQEYLAAMHALARTFISGPAMARNWELGRRWLLLATESGDAEALCCLRRITFCIPIRPVATRSKPESGSTTFARSSGAKHLMGLITS